MAHLRRLGLVSLFGLVLLVCVGCSVRFISDYDDVLDKDVTALQQDTETFLNHMISVSGTPSAAFDGNRTFYEKTDASLRTMATRAASQPKPKVVVEEIKLLQKEFADLEALHKQDGATGLKPNEVNLVQGALETDFQNILTLELALKTHNGVPSAALAPSTSH